MDNPDILEYKNFWLFYKNLYNRLFNLITTIIDENNFNIHKIKDDMLDFMDNYSYYLLKKKLITKEQDKLMKNELIKLLKSFDIFTDSIRDYPTDKYIVIQTELKKQNYNLSKLSQDNYNYLIREYYSFFNELITILKDFVDISSTNGFLPNIRSKTSLKSIGYANYDLFFTQLEELKIKMSSVTSGINLRNIFKSRRCVYCMLVIFSPYFNNQEAFESLVKSLNFDFINDDKILREVKQSIDYQHILDMPKYLRDILDKTILIDLKKNISIIKRYISFEFGERDMSPRIKKKYGYDPTDT